MTCDPTLKFGSSTVNGSFTIPRPNTTSFRGHHGVGHFRIRAFLPFDAALSELRACEPLVELLGPTFVEAFALVKEAEYEVFLQVISSWEREHLLLNV